MKFVLQHKFSALEGPQWGLDHLTQPPIKIQIQLQHQDNMVASKSFDHVLTSDACKLLHG